MKTISSRLMLLAAAVLLFSCQNQNVRMHTTVHANGDCTREVSYSNVMTQAQRDSVWGGTTGWSQPMPECLNIDAFCKSYTEIGEGDTVTTTFEQRFRSVEEMCAQTPLQLGGVRMRSHGTLHRRFRWFYTEYDFTEVIGCVADSFPLPATDYADAELISYWFTGQPNLIVGLSGAEASERLGKIENLVSRWLNDNFCQLVFNHIAAHYDSIPNPPVRRDRFVALRDSLSCYLVESGVDVFLGNEELSQLMHDFFHSDAYAPFFDDETPLGKELSEQLAQRLSIFSLNVPYTLQMPGTVINPGNGILRPDGIVFYPLTGERLIPHDYVIHATSRKNNIWAWIISALIILLAIGLFFRKKS